MPRYDYRCRICGEVEEVTHGFHDNEDVMCVGCDQPMGKLVSDVNVAPSVTPSRSGVVDLEATKSAEREKDRDMAAYKRLRKDGVQPPSINGSAQLEAKAENSYEVNSGHTFKTASGRRRSMSLVKDVVDNQ